MCVQRGVVCVCGVYCVQCGMCAHCDLYVYRLCPVVCVSSMLSLCPVSYVSSVVCSVWSVVCASSVVCVMQCV